MEVTNRYVVIKAKIDCKPQESDFEFKTETLSLPINPLSNDVIVKNLCISIDPYMINRMKTASVSQKISEFAIGISPGEPKKGEKVFVSAACGSVGNLVGQYAKNFGCYVVGCAGSTKKVKLLKEKLGFDEAFNYNEESNLKLTLERYFPDGIDIYFDNVGGEMLEAAISTMNLHGRVAICGIISEYTNAGKRATPDMLSVMYKSITIQGFLVGNYLHLFPEFLKLTIDHLHTGKMHVLEDVSFGLESVPSAFVWLFRGDNVGKRCVQISED